MPRRSVADDEAPAGVAGPIGDAVTMTVEQRMIAAHRIRFARIAPILRFDGQADNPRLLKFIPMSESTECRNQPTRLP
jgi:hypothetical protein